MLKILYLLISNLALCQMDIEFPFECDKFACQNQGDKKCDPLCMNPSCYYDAPSGYEDKDWLTVFQLSDCSSECEKLGCDLDTLGLICDPSCDKPECGFGLGKCGYCNSGCTETLLTNNECDSVCNTRACMYDNNACGWCAPNCFKKDLNSTDCNKNCAVPECNYQNLVCNETFCAPKCTPEMHENLICDDECDVIECKFDNFKCPPFECTPERNYSSEICYLWCDEKEYGYQNGFCGNCSSQCFENMLGNKVCDNACNVISCGYDLGDCAGCAIGCRSAFNSETNSWVWEDACKAECLVESCLYNYGACDNPSKIRAAWFQQIAVKDFNSVLNLSHCYSKHPECTEDILWGIDKNKICNEICDNADCFNCMGLSDSFSCTRGLGSQCLICLNSNQIYDHCFHSQNCPPGFSLVSNLTENFLGAKICFRDPMVYNSSHPFEIYVSQSGDDENDGTIDNPVKSLSVALQLSTRKFNKIILTPGTHHFTKAKLVNPLIIDPTSPLEMQADIYIESINITGSSIGKSVIYLIEDNMKFKTKALNLIFSLITFNGTYALSKYCDKPTCMYCPSLVRIGEVFVDDMNQIVTNIDEYAQNCSDYIETDFISVSSGGKLTLINVTVENFRQQLRTFIYSEGDVDMKNANFYNIQNYKLNYFITVVCKTNCTARKFTYESGEVRNFNNGYKYSALLVQPGFLKIENLNQALLKNLKLNYTMVITGSQATITNYLISVKDILDSAEITFCEFNNAFVNGILNIDTSSLSYKDLTLDEINSMSQYGLVSFVNKNCTFQNIISLGCLICYPKGKVRQNIEISGSKFDRISVNHNALISIASVYSVNILEGKSKEFFVEINGTTFSREIQNEKLEIKNTIFQDIFYSEGLIYLKDHYDVSLINLVVKNLKEYDLNSINSLIFFSFIDNPEIYLKQALTSAQLPVSQCNNIIEIISASTVQLTNVTVALVHCSNGTSGLSVFAVEVLTITNSKFSDISGNYKSNFFHLFTITKIDMEYVKMTNITQSVSAILRAFNSSNFKLNNFSGKSLNSFDKPCLSLEKIKSIKISSFICTDCGSNISDGGAVFIIPDITNSKIDIENFTCELCYSKQGNGGAINLKSESIETLHTLKLFDSRFIECSAVDGASVYISPHFSLDNGLIDKILIADSIGTAGGVFADYHSIGMLSIDTVTFINTRGHYSAIKSEYSQENKTISLKNVLVSNSTALFSIFYFDSTDTNAIVELANVTVRLSSSRFLTASYLNLHINDTVIDSGQGIFLDHASFKGRDIIFSGINGYAIRSSNSKLVCINLKLSNFTVDTALVIENNSTFSIQDSVFNNIYSKGPGIILSMSGCPELSYFENSSFTLCSSDNSPLMDIKGSKLSISNCKIEKNKSSGPTSGISLLSSNLYLNNSTLANQESISGGFINLYTSNLVAYNTSFDKGLAKNGGAIFSALSTISVNNCKFTSNHNSGSEGMGGALYGVSTSNFTIVSCIFLDNTSPSSGSSIYFLGTSLLISHSNFSTLQPTSVIISLSNIDSLIFENSNITGQNTSGISSMLAKDFKISQSIFRNLQGAISAMSSLSIKSNVYTFKNCQFLENYVSTNGAALNLNGISLVINQSVFSENSAHNGGAINFICPGSYCLFNISDSRFSNNEAKIEGGGIKWADNKPKLSNVNFTDNLALYSGDIASFAAILALSSARSLAYMECIPGQVCENAIKFEIQDTSRMRMIQDSTSIARITVSTEGYSISGNSTAVAKAGVFTFNDYIISGKPGTEVNISISTATIDVKKANQVGDVIDYIDSVSISVKLKDCVLGDQRSLTSCTPCEPNSYTFNSSEICKSCPKGGNCTGGWKIYPLPGYWKSENLSDVIYSCSSEDSCLGAANESDFIGECAKGYMGNKCFGCENGYSRSSSGSCTECPEYTSNFVLLIFIIVIFIIEVTIFAIATINSGYSKSSHYSIYIKIFTNYLQLVTLMSQLDLHWPWFILQLFSVQNTIIAASDQLFSFDCYLQIGGSDYSSMFFKKQLMMAVLPPVLWIISLIIWIFICFNKKNFRYLKREYFTTMIVCFFLIYPSIVKVMFSIFSCVYISGSGYWMAENLQIKCWGEDYLQNKLIVALPSIIVWVIGVPTFALIKLHKNRSKFHKTSVRVIFGFFFNGYRRSMYFWEFLIIYRKIAIICIVVFLNQISSDVQGLTLALALLIILYLQLRFQPYSLNQLNHLETEGILTAAATIYCGLYFLYNQTRLEISVPLFIVIVLGNMYYVCYWVLCMARAGLNLISERFYWVRRLVYKTDPFPEYVFQKEIVKQGLSKKEGSEIYSLVSKKVKKTKILHLRNVKSFDDLQDRVFNECAEKIYEDNSAFNNEVETCH